MSQCKGITRSGDRCKRRAVGYCHLHVPKLPPVDEETTEGSSSTEGGSSTEGSSSTEECPICMEALGRREKRVKCNECRGLFHVKCIARMVNFNCPLCRESLETLLNSKTIRKIRENKEKKDREDAEEARRISANYRRAFANTSVASIFGPHDIGTMIDRYIQMRIT